MTNYIPRLWGQCGWVFLEHIALGYPDNPSNKDKLYYKQLFEMLKFTLPCEECRINYSIHIKETPIDDFLSSSYSLYEWIVIIQNKTNRMLNKPYIDHEESRIKKFRINLEKQNKPCCKDKKKGASLAFKPLWLNPPNKILYPNRMTKKKVLSSNVRAKKNELKKAKELRQQRKIERNRI